MHLGERIPGQLVLWFSPRSFDHPPDRGQRTRGERIGMVLSLFRNPASGMPMRPSPAPIAQLDRASGYEPGGRTFESCWAHQNLHPVINLQLHHLRAPIDVMRIVT
jgi:hypothetical protein